LIADEIMRALYVNQFMRDKELKSSIPFSKSEIASTLQTLLREGLIEISVDKPRFKAYSLTHDGRNRLLEDMARTTQELLAVVRKLPNPLETAEAVLTDEVLKRSPSTGDRTGELSKMLAHELVKNWLNLLLQQVPNRISRAIENLEPGDPGQPAK